MSYTLREETVRGFKKLNLKEYFAGHIISYIKEVNDFQYIYIKVSKKYQNI
ncbi:hypothetical protein LEP1GSC125_0959 [Leptospira mayottensis 200901122]|uniref:Uncharacterized protein n=1 Tax=Leptospira mayottensis 200901122 TaxID=1193010 RepID=A0AA87MTM1_9LEPT|nr:hypothetical protein LEP1GSC125_0959 [Leptospira mayottensis 200901122]